MPTDIAGDSSLSAERVLGRLEDQATRLAHIAERGRRIPEPASRKRQQRSNWRELLVRPWRIVYTIEADLVLALAVVDGRRDLRAWLAGRSAADLSRRTP